MLQWAAQGPICTVSLQPMPGSVASNHDLGKSSLCGHEHTISTGEYLVFGEPGSSVYAEQSVTEPAATNLVHSSPIALSRNSTNCAVILFPPGRCLLPPLGWREEQSVPPDFPWPCACPSLGRAAGGRTATTHCLAALSASLLSVVLVTNKSVCSRPSHTGLACLCPSFLVQTC